MSGVLTRNLLLERQAWLQRLLDPRRDLDRECGHPVEITVADYRREFLRGDIASRVVSLMPEESWADTPGIFETDDETETEFEKAWTDLDAELNLCAMLERADILSGIGRFGVLLLGIDDGLALNQPAAGVNEKGETAPAGREQKLLFCRAFDESLTTVKELEANVTNPRYGMPTLYTVNFTDTALGVPTQAPPNTTATQDVHWSRVIHLADNRTSSEIFGLPRMEKVFNRLLDIKKIAGGSGEMFWKGGFPGLSLESNPNLTEGQVDFDEDKTKEQLEAYMNGLQRYMALVGMQAKSLTTQVADPGPHLEVQLRLIATAMGVPWRVFIGSEAAQLASEQDTRAWNKRINRRRKKYLDPFVILPFLNRLIAFGCLPEPQEIIVDWPDLNSLTEKDKAEVAERRSNALNKYVLGGVDALMPPFYYLTLILGLEDDEARAIIDDMGDDLIEDDRKQPEPAPAGRPAAAAGAARRNGG